MTVPEATSSATPTLVIIPAFNEEEALPAVLATWRHRPDLDVIVVDDGSTDPPPRWPGPAGRHRALAAVQPRHRRRPAHRVPLRRAQRATTGPSSSTATASTTPTRSRRCWPRSTTAPTWSSAAASPARPRPTASAGCGPGPWASCASSCASSRASSFTDTSSGFRAFNRDGARVLRPRPTPSEYMESVEALLLACAEGFRVDEVPVHMQRARGRPAVHPPAAARLPLPAAAGRAGGLGPPPGRGAGGPLVSRSAQLVVMAIVLFSILFILRLVRQRKLRGKYALLWVAVGAVPVRLRHRPRRAGAHRRLGRRRLRAGRLLHGRHRLPVPDGRPLQLRALPQRGADPGPGRGGRPPARPHGRAGPSRPTAPPPPRSTRPPRTRRARPAVRLSRSSGWSGSGGPVASSVGQVVRRLGGLGGASWRGGRGRRAGPFGVCLGRGPGPSRRGSCGGGPSVQSQSRALSSVTWVLAQSMRWSIWRCRVAPQPWRAHSTPSQCRTTSWRTVVWRPRWVTLKTSSPFCTIRSMAACGQEVEQRGDRDGAEALDVAGLAGHGAAS